MYPAFVGAVSLVVAGVLLVNVAPEIVALFEQTGQPLPRITRVSLGLGQFLGAYWAWLAAGLAGLAVAARLALGLSRVRFAWDRLLLRLPVIGPLVRLRAAALYLRTARAGALRPDARNSAMRFAVGAVANTRCVPRRCMRTPRSRKAGGWSRP